MNRNIMKKKHCVFWVMLLLCMTVIFSLSAFAAAKKVKKITLSKTKLTMYVGKSKTLKCTVKPSGASKKVVWKSSKPSVVSVSQKGKLKAKKAGKATITCSSKKYPKIKATCKVTVKKPAVKEITLSETEITLNINESKDLTAAVSPKYAPEEVKWESSDTDVATVSDEGSVKGIKAGTAIITCSSVKYPKIGAECKVTVKKSGKPLTDEKELATAKLILSRTGEPAKLWKFKNQKSSSKSGKNGTLWSIVTNANGTISYIALYNDYVSLGRSYCLYNIPVVTASGTGGSSVRSAIMDGTYDFKNDPNGLLVGWSVFTSSTSKAEFEKMINNTISDSAFEAVHRKAANSSGYYTNSSMGGSCIIVYGKDTNGALIGKYAGVISYNMADNGCAYELVGINPENETHYGMMTADTQGYALY